MTSNSIVNIYLFSHIVSQTSLLYSIISTMTGRFCALIIAIVDINELSLVCPEYVLGDICILGEQNINMTYICLLCYNQHETLFNTADICLS